MDKEPDKAATGQPDWVDGTNSNRNAAAEEFGVSPGQYRHSDQI
ncbi:hypothetical protein [Larkinella sp. GY13]